MPRRAPPPIPGQPGASGQASRWQGWVEVIEDAALRALVRVAIEVGTFTMVLVGVWFTIRPEVTEYRHSGRRPSKARHGAQARGDALRAPGTRQASTHAWKRPDSTLRGDAQR